MAYKPELPVDVVLPAGYSVDVNHPAYKQLEAVATEEKWTQKSFSRVLGIEGRRQIAEHAARAAAAAPAPAPAAPAPKPNFEAMATREQFAYSLAHSPTAKPRGG